VCFARRGFVRLAFLAVLMSAVVTVTVLIASSTIAAQDSPIPAVGWTAEVGGFSDVQAIEVLGTDNVWAVGSSIIRFDGRNWRAIDPQPHSQNLKGLDVSMEGYGWAVGVETAIPYRGGAWQEPIDLEDGLFFEDVAVVSATDAWSVGNDRASSQELSGIIWHYDGQAWAEADIPDVQPLQSVWMASAVDGWAVGRRGTLLRFDGSDWGAHASPTDDHLYAIHARSTEDIWVAGGTASGQPTGSRQVILHFDGSEWQVAFSARGAALRSIWVGDQQGWAVGEYGVALHYNGRDWTDIGPVRGAVLTWIHAALTSVAGTSDGTQVYAGADTGGLIELDGASWSLVHRESVVRGILVFENRDGWAVAPKGPALRWNGQFWYPYRGHTDVERLYDIDGPAADNVWGVGSNGLIMHFNGDFWSVLEPITDVNLHRIRFVSPDRAVAVGYCEPSEPCGPFRGTLLEFVNGEWRVLLETAGSSSDFYHDADVTSRGVIWLAKNDGILRIENDETTEVATNRAFWSLDMVSEARGVAGSEGSIYQWDGSKWRLDTRLPFGTQVRRIAMDGLSSGWAVGWYGYVLQFNGKNWQPMRSLQPELGTAGLSVHRLEDFEVVQDGDETVLWTSGGPFTILRTRVLGAHHEYIYFPALSHF
jgi:hypothetical protein